MLRNTEIHIKYTTERTANVDNISEALLRNDRGFLPYWQQEIHGRRVLMLCKWWCAKANVQCFIARASSAMESYLQLCTPKSHCLYLSAGSLLLWTISLSQLGYQIIITHAHIYFIFCDLFTSRGHKLCWEHCKRTNTRDTISSDTQSLSLVISFPSPLPKSYPPYLKEGRKKGEMVVSDRTIICTLKITVYFFPQGRAF